MELKLEEFLFSASYIDNQLHVFESGNYMNPDEIKLLSNFLLEVIRKESKMKPAKKGKKIVAAPKPKTTKKKK